jgi:plastocyanin
MKKTILFLLVILASTSISFSTTHVIANSGFSFSPSSITINIGDTVNFVLESSHNAREVSQATWNANGTTSNGGFDVPFGGGKVVLTQTGTHYYVCVPHASIGMKGTITVNSAADVETMRESTPDNFTLMQNYPNPFNPTTTISFALGARSFVLLTVFDLVGKQVGTILSAELPPGRYLQQWNATDLPSGVYFYRLQAGDFVETKKLILLR